MTLWIEMTKLDWQSKSKIKFRLWIVNHNPICQIGLQSGLSDPAIPCLPAYKNNYYEVHKNIDLTKLVIKGSEKKLCSNEFYLKTKRLLEIVQREQNWKQHTYSLILYLKLSMLKKYNKVEKMARHTSFLFLLWDK